MDENSNTENVMMRDPRIASVRKDRKVNERKSRTASYEQSPCEPRQPAREAMTTQRFTARVNNEPYHVRVLLQSDESVHVTFYNPKEPRTTRVKKLDKHWLMGLGEKDRLSFLSQGNFFRKNIRKFFDVAVASDRAASPSSMLPYLPSKPARSAPPLPESPEDDTFENERINELETTIKELKLELIAARENGISEQSSPDVATALESDLAILKESLTRLELEKEALSTQVNQLNSVNSQISSESNELLQTVEQLKTKLDAQQDSVPSQDQEVSDLKEKIASLELKLSNANVERNDAAEQTELQDQSEEMTSVIEERDALRKELEQIRTSPVQLAPELSENIEAEIGQLKIKLMDSEAEKLKLSERLQFAEQEVEATIEECEKMIKEANDHRNSEVQQKTSAIEAQLTQEQGRTRLLTEQLEVVRSLQEEEAAKTREALATAEDRQTALTSLSLQMDTMMKEQKEEQKENQLKIKKLEADLETMTSSKDQHKAYGVELKSRIKDLHSKTQAELSEAQQTIASLQKSESSLLDKNKTLSDELNELKKNAESERQESLELAKELAAHGHELKSVKAREAEVSSLLQAATESKDKLEEEMRILAHERKTRIAEFEAQMHKQHTQHEEEIARLKVQIFDATEQLNSKKDEVEELNGYVSNLMDEHDKITNVLCQECKSRAAAACVAK